MNKNIKGIYSGGYTLLFAVITAALVLGVAVFILDISTRQYQLSASARESMYSFYAADSGIECVALNSGVYSTSTASTFACGKSSLSFAPANWAVIADGGATYPNDGGSYYELTFNLDFGLGPAFTSSDTCANILIDEYYNMTDYSYHDIVQSRGYNHCLSTLFPDTNNPLTVERALQLSHSTN